jgi:type VI secretion system protein ImpA
MATEALNLQDLLAPIPGDNPCGENLRWDPVYDKIKEARRETDRDAFGSNDPVEADWAFVFDTTIEALTERSKDLMLAGYLVQALVEKRGFVGLRDGLRLVGGLLDTFWDDLYPQIEGGDLEPRAAPIVWLTEADRGGRIPSRIRDVGLAPGVTADGWTYSWSLWKSRYEPPKGENEDDEVYARRKGAAEERTKFFEEAVGAAPVQHFGTLQEELVECLDELKAVDARLDDRFGREAPGTTGLRTALEDCLTLVRRVIKDKGGLPTDGPNGTNGEDPDHPGGPTVASGPIRSRGDALRRLSEVAEYFRQVEPHSPISYLVDRAVTWGYMSFDRLLEELIKDTGVRGQIGELLGLKRGE